MHSIPWGYYDVLTIQVFLILNEIPRSEFVTLQKKGTLKSKIDQIVSLHAPFPLPSIETHAHRLYMLYIR